MAAKRATRKKTTKKAPAKRATKKAPAKKATKKRAKKKTTAKKATKKKAAKKRSAKKADGGRDSRVAMIQEVIDVMVERGAVEVEMRESEMKLRVRLKEDHPPVAFAAPQMAMPASVPAAPAPAAPTPAAAPAAAVEIGGGDEGHPPGTEVFRSPMVGTFYRASSPEAEAFVKDGDSVSADTTICIIEAMKVMNEIKSEGSMEIVKVLAENGEPVEYDQPLFLVKA